MSVQDNKLLTCLFRIIAKQSRPFAVSLLKQLTQYCYSISTRNNPVLFLISIFKIVFVFV